MKIDIVVGRTWHAVDMAAGLSDLGHDCVLISSDRSYNVPLRRVPFRSVLRVAERVRTDSPLARLAFGALATWRVRKDAVAVCWSSFGAPTIATHDGPVVVIRGSHHIRTQARLLEGTSEGPRPLTVAVEEFEYRKALFVSVPTDEIAADPNFARGAATALVDPYGFPILDEYREAGVRATKPVVLFAGQVGLQKGIDRLMNALARPSPGYDVAVAGPMSRSKVRLPSHWRYLGHLPREQLLRHMAAAACLVLPSRQEGMARVGQEAMAVGTPVIATPEAGLSRWIKAGGGVELASRPSAVEIRDAIGKVLGCGDVLRCNAAAVAKSWTWRDHAQTLVDQIAERGV